MSSVINGGSQRDKYPEPEAVDDLNGGEVFLEVPAKLPELGLFRAVSLNGGEVFSEARTCADDLAAGEAAPKQPSEPHALASGASAVVCEAYGEPTVLGRLESELVTEASGLVVSSISPGVIWTHNDSGGGPELFAFTRKGRFLGTLTLVGAEAVDWEDMAAGPCGEQSCLYVGDIGDNLRRREELVVYRLVEPVISPHEPFGSMEEEDWTAFPFRYPDGSHDAEALIVDLRGRPFVLTKVPRGASRLYRFPAMRPGELVTLEDLGELFVGDGPLSMATAADLHPNGRRLLVRTYLHGLEWLLQPEQSLADLPGTEGVEVPVQFELQGEAIAYDPHQGGYIHLSEGLHPDLNWIPCAN